MLGAIIGDIIGSRFEWNNHRNKDFQLFTHECFPTDDTVMSLAVAQAILISKPNYSDLSKRTIECMQRLGKKYPNAGYGYHFYKWLFSNNPKPYNSCGNGSAMRISPAGFAAKSLKEAKRLSYLISKTTHNHPEGLKGAETTAVTIFLAKSGYSMQEIQNYIQKHYYDIDFTLNQIRNTYKFDETCQNTVPQALQAFFESTDFEDAIRNAVSIGGDSDTIAAICGGIAEAYYGIPQKIKKTALSYINRELLGTLLLFQQKYQKNK